MPEQLPDRFPDQFPTQFTVPPLVPVPVKVTWVGVLLTLVRSDTAPGRTPVAFGRKRPVTWQLFPASRKRGQLWLPV